MIVFIFFSAILFCIMIATIYDNSNLPVVLKNIIITILAVITVIGLIYLLFIGAIYLAFCNVSRETFLEFTRYQMELL